MLNRSDKNHRQIKRFLEEFRAACWLRGRGLIGVGRLEPKREIMALDTRFQEPELPEVSRFFGIVIAMYYNDHSPPHFHAKYSGDQASIRIDNGAVVEGKLGTRAMRLVEEWRVLRQAQLLEDWNRARARQPLNQIEPLE